MPILVVSRKEGLTMFDTASMTDFWLRVLGLYFLVAGLGVFAQVDKLAGLATEMRESVLGRWLSAILAFAVGVLILATRDGSGGGPAMIVTIIGWVSLIKGIFLFAAPPALFGFYDSLLANRAMLRVWGVVIVLAGGGLIWLGYPG